ncbi:MAG: hypothetical protein RI897_4630 [Verrucomicrobiota bacterium]
MVNESSAFTRMRLRKTVLVVDDERGARVAATMVLRDRYPVVSVANGVEAMELADTYPPALVITNNRMPGMSGLELLAWFRIRYPLLPFIILTGYRTRETIRRAVELRVNFYITKPYDPKTLRAAVDHGIFEDQIHFTPDADGKLLHIWSRLLGFRRVLGQCRQGSSLDWDFMASDLERLRDLLTEAVAGYGPDPESFLSSALLSDLAEELRKLEALLHVPRQKLAGELTVSRLLSRMDRIATARARE